MSVSLLIVPFAITMISIAADHVGSIIENKLAASQNTGEPCVIETRFVDKDLLCKTLQEHGLDIVVVNENTIRSQCKDSSIVFSRNVSSEPFSLTISSAAEIEALRNELKEINEEYGMNVQSYTYNHVKNSLDEGMSVSSEEVLEDNSILLTITLD